MGYYFWTVLYKVFLAKDCLMPLEYFLNVFLKLRISITGKELGSKHYIR